MNSSDYNSIDRLMEFGLSMAVAQQMTQSFNSMLKNNVMPQVPFPQKEPAASEWYYAVNNNIAGPATDREIKNLLVGKKITSSTLMWKGGMTTWQPAGDIPEILNFIMQLPPAL